MEIVQIKESDAGSTGLRSRMKTVAVNLNNYAGHPLFSIFRSLGLIYYVEDCIRARTVLDADLAQFKELNGKVPKENQFYGDGNLEKATTHYYQKMQMIVGKAATSMIAVLLPGALLRGIGLFLAVLPGIGILGAVVNLFRIVANLAVPAALVLIESGKLKDTFIEAFMLTLYSIVGLTVTPFWNKAVEKINDWSNDLEITKDGSVKKRLTIPSDPKDPMANLLKAPEGPIIAGLAATDDGVHLTLAPDFYFNPLVIAEIRNSITSGKGNPLDKIPRFPGKIYPTWVQWEEKYKIPPGFATQWKQSLKDGQ